jgi:phosphopantetheine adenylyltransferase
MEASNLSNLSSNNVESGNLANSNEIIKIKNKIGEHLARNSIENHIVSNEMMKAKEEDEER